MSKTNWTIRNITRSTNYSGIRALNFSTGRRNITEDQTGNYASFTITNNTESDFNTFLGDEIRIWPNTPSGSPIGAMAFWVTSFVFNDEPGSMNNSTVTIVAEDSVARLGRNGVFNQTATAGDLALIQASTMVLANGTPVVAVNVNGGTSTASGQSYTGSVADFIRVAVKTEFGYALSGPIDYNSIQGGTISFYGRDIPRVNEFRYVRKSTDATANGYIVYQDIQRDKFFDVFANNVEVSPLGLAEQIASDSASIAAYGTYSVSQGTIDETTTQALGLAEYLAAVLSDVNLTNFVLTFSDSAQPTDSYYNYWLTALNQFETAVSPLYYRKPGAVTDTEEKVTMLGYQVSATPAQTNWTCYFAPMSVYQFFILDSTTQGILDTSRLGW